MNFKLEPIMSRRQKPHDPGKATQAALERRANEAEKARLLNMGATVNTDRTGRVISAYRSNVFRLLLERGTITANHHDAAYTLAKDWAAWKGLDGKPETFGEFVDGGSGSAELVTDRMMKAGRRVKAALGCVDAVSMVILEAFMVATVEDDRPRPWRVVMERLGITSVERQTTALVCAVEALRAFYQDGARAAA